MFPLFLFRFACSRSIVDAASLSPVKSLWRCRTYRQTRRPPQTPSTPPLPLVHLFPSSCSRDPRRRAGRRARQLTMDPIVSPRRPSGPPTSSATPSLPHRLKAIPSSRTGVADVPLSPTGQKRFYSVHDGLLAFGAKDFGSVDEIEVEVFREQEEEEKRPVLLPYVPLDCSADL